MKKSIFSVFLLLFALEVYSKFPRNEMAGFIAITGGENAVSKELAIRGGVPVYDMDNYVSITDIGEGRFAISNYKNIFIFDRADSLVCVVSVLYDSAIKNQVKAAHGFPFDSNSGVNPTGVFFAKNNKLYVANYKINNILEGSLDVGRCEFHVEHEYSSPSSLGPENVWVDENSNLLFSANYDAGTVAAFNVDTKQEVWVADVPQAHGVSVSNGKVYATGLTERKIYKINISNGEIIQEKGGLGWRPMNSEFMWPTSIHPFSSDEMIVADAQSGFISIVDAESLDTIYYTGGNGPSGNLFNYPYAATRFGDEIAVMQSQRKGIAFVSRKDFRVSENFYFMENKWPEQPVEELVFGKEWEGYQDFSGNNVKVMGDIYRLGFGNLHAMNGRHVMKMPDVGTLFNDSAYVYFLQAHHDDDLSLLLSSSSKALYGVVRMRDGINVLVPKQISVDSWLVGGGVISEGGVRVDLDDLSRDIIGTANQYHASLLAHGWIDGRKLYELLEFSDYGYTTYEFFLERLKNVFSSPEGRRFAMTYAACSDADVCDLHELRDAARKYYLETRYLPYRQLDEYLLVGMLTGVVANEELYQDVEYADCEEGSYYSGHGLNALYSKTLDDYLAAINLEGSTVCFSVKDNFPINGVDIVWNDMESASKSIEIYGRELRGQGNWMLVGQFSGYSISMKDGYAYSFIEFDKPENHAEFYLRVVDGGEQQRLLVRKIQPLIGRNMAMACHDSIFIEGYDVAALQTPSLQDYLSAYDLSSSSVCFSNLENLSVEGVKIGWFSKDEVGIEVEVFGASGNDFADIILIGKFAASRYEEGGYWFSDIHFNASRNYPFYKVKLVKGEGQNRFILRHLSLISN